MTVKGTVLRGVVRTNHLVDKAGAQVADLGQNIAKSNIWESVAKGATKYRGPLVAAAAITGTYVVGTKVLGRNEQRVLEQRGAAQEQGIQR